MEASTILSTEIPTSIENKVWSKEEKDAAMQLLVQEFGDTIESLPVIAEHIIVNEHVHLLDCLLENILIVVAAAAADDDADDADDAWTIVESDESALNSRRTRIKGLTIFVLLLRIRHDEKFIEPFLYIGLDATPYSLQIPKVINHPTNRLCKPSQSVVNAIYRSRILCLFKIMYHKFIFLSFDGIFQLVQTLLVEYLYDDKYKGAKRIGNSNYEGDIVDDGKMTVTGKGIYRWANGDSYEGDWVDSEMTGKGVFRWPNGNIYDGDFLDDKMATGQMFLADLNLNLAAEFSGGDEVDGYRLYRLVLKNPDGSVYREGDFSNGRFV